MKLFTRTGVWCELGLVGFCIATLFQLISVRHELVKNDMAYYNKAGNFVLNRPTPLVCKRDTFINNEYTVKEFDVTNWSLTDEKFILDNETNRLFTFESCKISKDVIKKGINENS
jgi:phosphomevalonate kinase